MKFRLKLWLFELAIETPEPVQVSPSDVAAAIWSAMTNTGMVEHVMVVDGDDEAD
ncbi:hypothetical protein [Nocardia otitidiscaviarum]|uniref:hypothetical protein n=1 Tax=Nocardia otitidiscaviarum TaxID=1823 RepID=UPI000ADD692F|nr:hypothetical protein [Nocardia otitidiscaviarum]